MIYITVVGNKNIKINNPMFSEKAAVMEMEKMSKMHPELNVACMFNGKKIYPGNEFGFRDLLNDNDVLEKVIENIKNILGDGAGLSDYCRHNIPFDFRCYEFCEEPTQERLDFWGDINTLWINNMETLLNIMKFK